MSLYCSFYMATQTPSITYGIASFRLTDLKIKQYNINLAIKYKLKAKRFFFHKLCR